MDAEQLAAHSRFFDSLVDLVPAKYYLDAGQDDRVRGSGRRGGRSPSSGGPLCLLLLALRLSSPGPRSRHALTVGKHVPQVNLKYMKKSARDEAKAAFKQQYKAAKRSKLDPDQAKGTLALQKEAAAAAARQQQGPGNEDSEGSDSDGDAEELGSGSGSGSDDEHRPQFGGAEPPPAQQGTALGQLAIPKGESLYKWVDARAGALDCAPARIACSPVCLRSTLLCSAAQDDLPCFTAMLVSTLHAPSDPHGMPRCALYCPSH